MGEAKRRESVEEERGRVAVERAGPSIVLPDGSVAPNTQAAEEVNPRHGRVEIRPDGAAARITFGNGVVIEDTPEGLVDYCRVILTASCRAFQVRHLYFVRMMERTGAGAAAPSAAPPPPV